MMVRNGKAGRPRDPLRPTFVCRVRAVRLRHLCLTLASPPLSHSPMQLRFLGDSGSDTSVAPHTNVLSDPITRSGSREIVVNAKQGPRSWRNPRPSGRMHRDLKDVDMPDQVVIEDVARRFQACAESLSDGTAWNARRMVDGAVRTARQTRTPNGGNIRRLVEHADRYLGRLVGHPRLAREPRVRT
jgi:hypothetical protein